MKILLTVLIGLFSVNAYAATLFTEGFDNSNFTSRGWYDTATSNPASIDSSDFAPMTGNTSSLICTYNSNGGCNAGSAGRHLFTPTNTLFVDYWTKYNSTYPGTGSNSGPHEIYILTTRDGQYEGLSYDYLDVYIQHTVSPQTGQIVPEVQIQDGKMIDEARINQNLIGVTENRAVAGCNGNGNSGGATVDGVFGGTNCYQSGSVHWNQYIWPSQTVRMSKNAWHHVQVYLQLNTVQGGIGQNDGIIKYTLDGNLIINRTNVIMRTGASPTMQFNQLIMGPYLGNPPSQTAIVHFDNMTVSTTDGTSGQVPNPPTNLTVQ